MFGVLEIVEKCRSLINGVRPFTPGRQ
jgi:hypothetical protein